MGEHITGLVAAPHTPMHADGSLRTERIDELAGLLARNGVAGAFVCGSTGEGLSLRLDERLAVAERWVAAGSDLRVIIHVGATSLADAKVLADHARRIGAWAVGAAAPTYFRPCDLEALADFCAEVADAAAPLPFYYYHIPALTGVLFPMHRFLPAASERFATMAGVKFTYEDLMDLRLCLELEGGRYDILFGRDEILLAGLAMGVRGAIGSTYNYAAPLYLRIVSAFEAGDLAGAQALRDVPGAEPGDEQGHDEAAGPGLRPGAEADPGPDGRAVRRVCGPAGAHRLRGIPLSSLTGRAREAHTPPAEPTGANPDEREHGLRNSRGGPGQANGGRGPA